MEPTLRDYYEQELRFLRQMASQFADKYPKLASRLVLREEDHPDPHVERLLEGVAFLAARVHLKIDDDFHEITDALLNLVYPHYIRPIPSITVVEFQLDSQQGKLTTGLRIPRRSMLYSRPVNGSPCKFTTSQEVTLWPLEVAERRWRGAFPIRVASQQLHADPGSRSQGPQAGSRSSPSRQPARRGLRRRGCIAAVPPPFL